MARAYVALTLERQRAEKKSVRPDDELWIRQAAGTHPLMRERGWSTQFGGALLTTATLVAGLACGVAAILLTDKAVISFPEWLIVPFVIPVVVALLARVNVLYGIFGGMVASIVAFMTFGGWMLLKVACFVITFMGEC